MSLQRWRQQRSSFGAAADLYDRVRPGYPESAVRWILAPAGPGPLRVVDLGAGTGILTRALLALGHQVLPVEPDPAMRARLAASVPEVTPLAGSAERIPVPDASVDAVVAGQAYHWFDLPLAHPEIARVLRPGGILGPLWNDRDESVGWLADLTDIAEGVKEPRCDDRPAAGSFGAWFGPLEQATFRHATSHTADSLVDLVRSRSYYLTAPAEQRSRIEEAVRNLTVEHPDLAGCETFDLPYITQAYRAPRVPHR